MVLLKNWLEKKAYHVKYTGNREEVAAIMEDFAPELVMVDVLQQDVARDINTRGKARSTPVLLMTGYNMRQKNSQIPFDDIIEKPFNLPLLEKKIERLIQGKLNVKVA